jgi:FAD/FMN-containing dehydrogenase
MKFTASSDGRRSRRARALDGQLSGRLQGQILLPGVGGYDRARQVFNAMIDRHPAVIIRCSSREDIVEGIGLARENGLSVTVKGGGHGVAGRAVCDRGVMLDLSSMKRVTVDPVERIATVEPGVGVQPR